MTSATKIGFVLLSRAARAIPSTRISVLNMLPYLRAGGFDPYIVFEPIEDTETPDVSGMSAAQLKTDGFQIIFFQKVHGESVVTLAKELQKIGIKTIFGVCDVVDTAMVSSTDATIVVTDYLRELHHSELQARISTVHDGIERPEVYKTAQNNSRGCRIRPLRAVLVTSVRLDRLPVIVDPPPWLHVTIVGRYPSQRWLQNLREIRWQIAKLVGWREKLQFLRFQVNPRIKRVPWDADGVYDAMLNADIGIIPVETENTRGAIERWQVKSENRLTLKMSVGLPVVATPIPSYLPVVQQGENAFLANEKTEWLDMLTALRDPALRQKIGRAARQTALAQYSMDRQADRLICALRQLVKI